MQIFPSPKNRIMRGPGVCVQAIATSMLATVELIMKVIFGENRIVLWSNYNVKPEILCKNGIHSLHCVLGSFFLPPSFHGLRSHDV